MLSSEQAGEILRSWQSATDGERREEALLVDHGYVLRMQYRSPTQSEVVDIISQTFFASIRREENRDVPISLMYVPEPGLAPWQRRESRVNILRFEKPVEMTAANIVKISQAVNPTSGSLLVERSSQPPGYDIVGMAPVLSADMLITGSHRPFAPPIYNKLRPAALVVNSAGPGSLVVARGDQVIARYADGQLFGTHDHSAMPYSILSPQEDSHWFWGEASEGAYIYLNCLEEMLVCAIQEGHGGTIIMCPASGRVEAETYLEGGVRVQTGTVIAALVRQLHALNAKHVLDGDREDVFRRVDERWRCSAELLAEVRGLARLSMPDGALIIDDEFVPFRFATKLRAPRWEGEVVLGRDVSRDGDFNRGSYGTRHNSAIDFAASVPSSIAFVVSSDGPVRAFARTNDVVEAWPDCLGKITL